MVQASVEKRNVILDNYNLLFDIKTALIKQKIEYITSKNSNIRIDNIGINAGNTMRQVYGYYNKKGVADKNSLTLNMVVSYIERTMIDAENFLNRYIDEFDPDNLVTDPVKGLELIFGSKIKKKLYIMKRLLTTPRIPNQNSEYLKEYRNLQDNIFYFDLERDIVSIIDEDLDNYGNKDEWYKNDVNDWIDAYNKELELLEIPNRVSHRYFDDNGVEYKENQHVKIKAS